MAVSLGQAREAAERARVQREARSAARAAAGHADPFRYSGPELLRHVWGSTRAAEREARTRLSDDEREALVSAVACVVIGAHGPHPRKQDASSAYCRTIALNLLRTDGPDGREWRDVAGTYRTARQRTRADDAPMIVAMPAELDSDDPLARAVLARSAVSGDPVPAMPADARELADSLGYVLAGTLGLAPTDARAVRVALLRAAMEADPREDEDSSARLAVIARELGVSLVTAKRASSRGAEILRAVPADTFRAMLADAREAAAEADPDPERTRPVISAEAEAWRHVIDTVRQRTRPARMTHAAGGWSGASTRDLRHVFRGGQTYADSAREAAAERTAAIRTRADRAARHAYWTACALRSAMVARGMDTDWIDR